MTFAIRPYHPTDLSALYRICLLTGDNGTDGSHLYQDPDLIGHHYAAPYAILEPDLCFVLTHNHMPVGYIIGTRDSAAFYERCEADWFGPLRDRYPLDAIAEAMSASEASIIRAIHTGHTPETTFQATYPAHLHIDILPIGQGGGWGKRLMNTFLDQLRDLGVPGVHLGVSKTNDKAVGFYRHIGFQDLADWKYSYALGLVLT